MKRQFWNVEKIYREYLIFVVKVWTKYILYKAFNTYCLMYLQIEELLAVADFGPQEEEISQNDSRWAF